MNQLMIELWRILSLNSDLFKPLWMNVDRGFKILDFLHLFQLFKQDY